MLTNVLQYLEASAKRAPEKSAFVDGKRTLTFAELHRQAVAVGSALCETVKANHPVAILMEKGALCISAFMGVVYAGCFYVPLDEKMPVERMQLIIDTLQPSHVIYDEKNANRLQALRLPCDSSVFSAMLDTPPAEERLAAIRQSMVDTDLLYVLFTSGSTGVPKGVTITHKGVLDYTDWVCDAMGLDETVRFGNQAPFHFDNSLIDIYPTLKQGATTYIIPQKMFLFPKLMVEYLNQNEINTIYWVPFALSSLANSGILEKERPRFLKRIYFSGEVMPCKQLNAWRSMFPEAQYCNFYGPTEITNDCTYYIVDRTFGDDESLPIGYACKNTRLFLLAEDDAEAAYGEPGELCVCGTSLSPGYYNNMEKTAAAFVQNPLNPYYPERIYRTGDLARYNERGELLFLGRKDFQIKHLGYRIELGEIETAINAMQGVTEACCLYDDEKKQIVCFYTGDCTQQDILAGIRDKLPSYMTPNRFVCLEAMPRTLNGKADRVTLRKKYIHE